MIFRKEKGEFIFPIADGRIKLSRGDQDLRTSTLIRERPIRGERLVDFLGESEGSLPPPHDSFPDAGEAIRFHGMQYLSPKENGKFYFSSRRWTNKICGRDQKLRTSTLIRDHPIRGEVMKLHFCFCISTILSLCCWNDGSVRLSIHRHSWGTAVRQIVYSEVWCFCTAHSLHPIQTRLVLTRDRAHLLLGSRPIAFRHFALDWSQWLPPLETRSANVRSVRIRYPIDRLCCCLSQCQSLLDLVRAREHWVAWFYLPLPAEYLQQQHHARGIRGSNPGVRQGCPASGFLFAMAFVAIFRWLQDVFNPRNLDFLQPTQCAYVDDLAVAALSVRGLMTALAPAFRSVDYIASLNLNYRKWCCVQYGTEGRESLWQWISETCEEFREMQIVRHANYVGTMIGPDGHLHRWSAPRKNHAVRAENQCICQELGWAIVWLQDLCDFCAEFLLVPYAHPTRQPSRPRTMPFSEQMQDGTTLYLLTFLELALNVVLVLTWWVFNPSASRLAIELLHARPRLTRALRKSKRLVAQLRSYFRSISHLGQRISCSLRGLQHRGCFRFCFSFGP